MDGDKLLDDVVARYLGSGDFNGYPCHHIRSTTSVSTEELRALLRPLIKSERISLVYGDRHPNPHIRAYDDEPIEQQLAKLDKDELSHTCLYPTAAHLVQIVNQFEYQDRPFTLQLALGTGQFEFRVFDLSVLEHYRSDPRYSYQNDDIRGSISIAGDLNESLTLPKRDQIDLQSFGFAYDADHNRAVAVFVRYLNKLTSEHQQAWKSKELEGEYRLHPDYYRNLILGEWGEWISIFDAFTEELRLINEMCVLMGRPRLFRNDYRNNKPREFGFIVRPTLYEYSSFSLTLDKMMSDNINKKFFQGDISDKNEKIRGDGRVEVQNSGTIAMLKEWLSLMFRSAEDKPMEEMIEAFKKVRRARQKPAHSLEENIFDQKYIHLQRELIITAYHGVRTIRLVFANHPSVVIAKLDIPDYIYEAKIWTY